LVCLDPAGLDGVYRLGRHSGPITAPVISNQDWNVATGSRGVATANQSYSGPIENTYLPVVTPGPAGGEGCVDYHAGSRMGSSLSYPVAHTSRLLELDLLKMQHEALRHSVEATAKFSVYKDPGYKSETREQQEWLSPEAPHTYTAVPSQIFSHMPHQPLVQPHQGSAGGTVLSLIQPTQDHTYSSTEQLLLSGMRGLGISQTSQEYQSSSGTAGTFPTGITQATPTVISTTPTIQSVNTVTSMSESSTSSGVTGTDCPVGVVYHTSHATPTMTSVTSSMGETCDASAMSGGGASRNQEELEDEIRRLQEQLRESSHTIQQQQAQLQNVPHPPPPTNPQAGARYPHVSLHQQHPYSGVSLSQQVSVQAPNLVDPLPAPPSQVTNYSSLSSALLSQYSPQQLQAALTLLMGSRGGVTGVGPSVNQTAMPNYYATSPYPSPRQWANSQATPPSQVYSGPHSLPGGSNITPPGTTLLMSLPGNSTATLPPQALVGGASRLHPPEHPDDEMLAAYIQMMEQNKAASAAPSIHPSHHSVYSTPQGQYYYQQ